MTTDRFRRIALGFEGAVESAHMGHPDFRANGRIFATLTADGQRGMVKLTPAQQQSIMAGRRDAFEPASGAWGRQGCTMVELAAADEEVVGEAMTLAWQAAIAAKPPAAKRKKTKTTTRRR